MSIVTLVSGGLDSTLLALMAKEQKLSQHPLYIDYGQRAAKREWNACKGVFRRQGLPSPARLDIHEYGRLIGSGLTRGYTAKRRAFLPGRNLAFLLFGAAYALEKRATAVAIGLLNDSTHIFPDQTAEFIEESERAIALAMGKRVAVLAPLMVFSKSDVLALTDIRGVGGTYSCHAGTEAPCGKCISCVEIAKARKAGPKKAEPGRAKWVAAAMQD